MVIFQSYISLQEGMVDVRIAFVNSSRFYHEYTPWTYGWFIIALPTFYRYDDQFCQFTNWSWRVSETRKVQIWKSKSDPFLKVTSKNLTSERFAPAGRAAGHHDNPRYPCCHCFASLISREFRRKPSGNFSLTWTLFMWVLNPLRDCRPLFYPQSLSHWYIYI